MAQVQIEIPEFQIKDFCTKWRVQEFCLFGSVLTADFHPGSDVDVLIRFKPGAEWDLFDFGLMREELEGIFGRSVDLVEREGIEKSRNPIRRKAILESAQVIHAA